MRDNARIQELYDQLGSAIGKLSYRHREHKDEILRTIADPDSGKEINAPDNYAMAELVLRRVAGSVSECAALMNDLYEEMGFAPPFPGVE